VEEAKTIRDAIKASGKTKSVWVREALLVPRAQNENRAFRSIRSHFMRFELFRPPIGIRSSLAQCPVPSVKKGHNNKLYPEDTPVHEWYRFVLSYPPHLVRDYIDHFKLGRDSSVLDPFCGTGTTIVEAQKTGLKRIRPGSGADGTLRIFGKSRLVTRS